MRPRRGENRVESVGGDVATRLPPDDARRALVSAGAVSALVVLSLVLDFVRFSETISVGCPEIY